MNVPLPLPFEFHRVAESLIARMDGIPYSHMGRDLKIGLDCIGQHKFFYDGLGLEFFVPDGATYPRDIGKAGITFAYSNLLMGQFDPIPERCVQFGDSIVFAKPGTGAITHTAIMVDPALGRFQHVWRDKKTGFNSLREPFWTERVHGFVRFKRFDILHDRIKHVPAEVKT